MTPSDLIQSLPDPQVANRFASARKAHFVVYDKDAERRSPIFNSLQSALGTVKEMNVVNLR